MIGFAAQRERIILNKIMKKFRIPWILTDADLKLKIKMNRTLLSDHIAAAILNWARLRLRVYAWHWESSSQIISLLRSLFFIIFN